MKTFLDNPALERNQIVQVQRKMLVTKKERMERSIASIDDILKRRATNGFYNFYQK